jgi:hypothetical protein
MVTRILGVLATLAFLVATARADSPKLQAARQAIADLKFDQARRALVEALAEGTHGPVAMREIYALSAEVAVVLGDRALGEQFYQRWLALDPTAKLPEGSAPKLRDAFVAAQAQMAARGRLALRTERTPTELVVAVASDPLAMIHAVAIEGAAKQPAPGKFAVAAAVAPRAYALDEHGNRLLETEPIAGSATPEEPPAPLQPLTPQKPQPSFVARWTTWAVPAGAFLIAGAVFGTLASVEHNKANDLLDDSTGNFHTDFEKHRSRFERYLKYGIVLGGVGVLLAIPATVFYIQSRKPWELGGIKVAPIANQHGGGLAAFGEF